LSAPASFTLPFLNSLLICFNEINNKLWNMGEQGVKFSPSFLLDSRTACFHFINLSANQKFLKR
jgi:hypothetical protein